MKLESHSAISWCDSYTSFVLSNLLRTVYAMPFTVCQLDITGSKAKKIYISFDLSSIGNATTTTTAEVAAAKEVVGKAARAVNTTSATLTPPEYLLLPLTGNKTYG